MIFLNMLSEPNRFQFVKQLFVVHTYNEHRIFPPKSGVWLQNGRDHSGHARFMSVSGKAGAFANFMKST